MDDQTMGIIGGSIGALVGIIGGMIGTYFSIKKTNGPKERQLIIRFSTILWGAMVPVGLLAYMLPANYTFLAFMPIWIALPFLIRYWNKKLQAVRLEESNSKHNQDIHS